MMMRITNFNVENEGMYICRSRNDQNETSKNVSISIKLAPIVEVVPSAIKLKEGDVASLKCDVKNVDGDYKIIWKDNTGVKQKIVSIQFKYMEEGV